MELKLAKPNAQNLKSKAAAPKITTDEILNNLKQNENIQNIFYFSRENAHKDMQKACDILNKAGHSTYLNEVRYGLDEESYIYELHVI